MRDRSSKARDRNEKRPQRNERARPESREEPRDNVVYGLSPVVEALRSRSRRVEKVLIAEGARDHRLGEVYELARSLHIPIDKIARERLERFAGSGVNHQGIAALTSSAEYVDASDILEGAAKPELLVILDGVQDPRNLGAILRTAECAGVDGVFIPERRAVGLTDTVAKSSAGAIEHVNVAKIGNLNRFIEELKEREIWVVGAGGEAAMDHTEWDWTVPTALVLGAEGSGLHRLVAENCDALVRIPMHGKIDSLNVSVAAGVILFEAQRQRKAATPEGEAI